MVYFLYFTSTGKIQAEEEEEKVEETKNGHKKGEGRSRETENFAGEGDKYLIEGTDKSLCKYM